MYYSYKLGHKRQSIYVNHNLKTHKWWAEKRRLQNKNDKVVKTDKLRYLVVGSQCSEKGSICVKAFLHYSMETKPRKTRNQINRSELQQEKKSCLHRSTAMDDGKKLSTIKMAGQKRKTGLTIFFFLMYWWREQSDSGNDDLYFTNRIHALSFSLISVIVNTIYLYSYPSTSITVNMVYTLLIFVCFSYGKRHLYLIVFIDFYECKHH